MPSESLDFAEDLYTPQKKGVVFHHGGLGPIGIIYFKCPSSMIFWGPWIMRILGSRVSPRTLFSCFKKNMATSVDQPSLVSQEPCTVAHHSYGKFQLGSGHKSWNIGEFVAEVKLIWNSDSIGQSLVKGTEGFKFYPLVFSTWVAYGAINVAADNSHVFSDCFLCAQNTQPRKEKSSTLKTSLEKCIPSIRSIVCSFYMGLPGSGIVTKQVFWMVKETRLAKVWCFEKPKLQGVQYVMICIDMHFDWHVCIWFFESSNCGWRHPAFPCISDLPGLWNIYMNHGVSQSSNLPIDPSLWWDWLVVS